MLWISPAAPTHSKTTAGPGNPCSGASLPEGVERRLLGGVDHDVRAEAVAGQLAPIGLEVRDDNRFDAAADQRRDGREPDRARADDDRNLAGLDARRADVELADGECIGQRCGVGGDISRDGLGGRFRNHQQLSETALRLGVLTDDPHTAGPAVDEANRHRCYPGTECELVGAAWSMPDDFADELVAQHDVAVGVVERATGRVVDGKFGVVHEVHVGRTDRGAQRPQQQLTRSGLRVRCFPYLKSAIPQDHSAQSVRSLSRIIDIRSRMFGMTVGIPS